MPTRAARPDSHRGEHGVYLVGFAHIAINGDRFAACLRDRFDHGVGAGVIGMGVDCNPCAGSAEVEGDRMAKSRVRSGDQRPASR